MSSDTLSAKFASNVVRIVDDGRLFRRSYEPNGFSWELTNDRAGGSQGRGSIMRWKVDLESRDPPLPSLQFMSRVVGDTNPTRHLDEHTKAWEVGRQVMQDYLTHVGLTFISEQVSEFDIPVLDPEALRKELEAGGGNRCVRTLHRTCAQQGFEQRWRMVAGDWKFVTWTRNVINPDGITMRISGLPDYGGIWSIQFASQDQPVLGQEQIIPEDFDAVTVQLSDPPKFDLIPTTSELPRQSFCLSAEQHQIWQAAKEAGDLTVTIRPLHTDLMLSDPNWDETVNDGNGIIDPGPPLNISVLSLNSQMRTLLGQLQPFHLPHWRPPLPIEPWEPF